MNATKPSAKDRRLAAARAINEKWTAGTEYGNHIPLVTMDAREEIAAEILTLLPLGRTIRWEAAVNNWAEAVRVANSIEQLRWAYVQYGWDLGYYA